MITKPKLIAVIGTTASGKSSLGIEIAERTDGEVVSADSRQIYIGLDLGTGKVTAAETRGVPHHLLDIIRPNEPFSVSDYQTLAYEAIDDIVARGKTPGLVGGTGLYSRAVTDGYSLSGDAPDESLRAELNARPLEELWEILRSKGIPIAEPNNKRRVVRQIERSMSGDVETAPSEPRYDVLKLGLIYPRDVLRRRIEERLDLRLEAGMVDEVRSLKEAGATNEFLEGLGLEYRYTNRYLNGEYADFDEYRSTLLTKICQFAKRQETWYKKEENCIWLDVSRDPVAQSMQYVNDFLKA